MSQLLDELRRILGSGQPVGRVGRALVDLLARCASDDEAIDLLATAVVERDSAAKRETTLDAKDVSQETWQALAASESAALKRFLSEALLEATDARDFARRLFELLSRYPTKDARAYLLANVLYSWYLPFEALPAKPVALDDDARKQAMERYEQAFAQMHRIAILPYRKTSEMAGLALDVLERVDDRDARVALLAMLIHRAQAMAGAAAERNLRAQASAAPSTPAR